MKLFVSLLLSLCARSLASGPSSPGSCLCIILVRRLGGVGGADTQINLCEQIWYMEIGEHRGDLILGIMSALEVFSFPGLRK